MSYVVVGGVIALCVIVMVSPMVFPSKRIRNHIGPTRTKFLATLAEEGIPISISAAVFDFYKAKANWRSFSPSPDMDINAIFEEETEDIQDTQIDLLKRLHLVIPFESEGKRWLGGNVKTISDMARWLTWADRNQPS